MAELIEILEQSTPDENGTVTILSKEVCSRCGGLGKSDAWVQDNGVCYSCRGRGFVLTTSRKYTAEYQKVLDAKRAEKFVTKRNHIAHEAMQVYMDVVTNNEYIYIATQFVSPKNSQFKYHRDLGAYALQPVLGTSTLKVKTDTLYYVTDTNLVNIMLFKWYGVVTRSSKDLPSVKSRGFRYDASLKRWYTLGKSLAEEATNEIGGKIFTSLRNARFEEIDKVQRVLKVIQFNEFSESEAWKDLLPSALKAYENM